MPGRPARAGRRPGGCATSWWRPVRRAGGRERPGAERRGGVLLRDRAGEPLPVRAVAAAVGATGRDAGPCSSSSTGRTPAAGPAGSTLPVAFARRSGELEQLVAERDVRVVLYLNQVEPNFRMLRFAEPVHIQLGHGESDKGWQHVQPAQGVRPDLHRRRGRAGPAGEGAARLRRRAADPVDRPTPARPRLPGRPRLADEVRLRVLYAPTWEGDRPSIAYGSLVSHGVAIVGALLADPWCG